ncbi:c-Myc-binding protein [Pseudoscourfieldia marina]
MATDSKKEAFRKYLESAGVIDSMTKVLVALYEEPEKPEQAIAYIKTQLGFPTPADYDELKASAKYEELEKEKEELTTKVTELEEKIVSLESAGEEAK